MAFNMLFSQHLLCLCFLPPPPSQQQKRKYRRKLRANLLLWAYFFGSYCAFLSVCMIGYLHMLSFAWNPPSVYFSSDHWSVQLQASVQFTRGRFSESLELYKVCYLLCILQKECCLVLCQGPCTYYLNICFFLFC